MLSSQAWNAFLKTLEEPPPHTIFVLATTEAQKVLPTVVDRCHRFDFGRPTVEQLATVLRRVADAGGDRDRPRRGRAARPPRDRLVPRRARHARAARHLQRARGRDRGRARRARRRRRRPAVRRARRRSPRTTRAPRCWPRRASPRAGATSARSMRDLEAHARELLVVQTLGEVPAELRVTPERDARLAEQAGRVGRADLVRLLELLADAMQAVKDGADARTQLELALVKAASPQVDPSARALMARLEALEAALARGGGAAPPRAAPAPAAAPAPRRRPRPPRRRRRLRSPRPRPRSRRPPPRRSRPTHRRRRRRPPRRPRARAPHGPRPPSRSPTRRPRRPSPRSRCPSPEDLDGMAAIWPAVLDAVCADNELLGAALADARPVELRDDELVVAFAARGPLQPARMADARRAPRDRRGRGPRPGGPPAAASASSCATSSPRTPRRSPDRPRRTRSSPAS